MAVVLFLALTACAPMAAAAELSEASATRAGAVSGAVPVLDQPSAMTLVAGTTADQALHASDSDGDPLSFSKPFGPPYMSVTTTDPGRGSALGNVHLAPLPADVGATTGGLLVSDGLLFDQRSLAITVTPIHVAPALAQPSDMTVEAGAVANQALSASDPDGYPLSFYLVSGPPYAAVGTSDPGPGEALGEISLTPGRADAGRSGATVGVTDGVLSDQKSLSITVTLTFFDQVTLPAVKDNTIYSESDMSYGGGLCLQVGRPGISTENRPLIRRALLQFDLSSIPAGSHIVSARLNLFRYVPGGTGNRLCVTRLLQDWGEGSSGAGELCTPPPKQFGFAPTESSSTWNYRFYGLKAVWETGTGEALHGGNFQTSFSDSEIAHPLDQFVGLASSGITSDAADWVRDPASNHGWILLGDEENPGTGLRFASRQDTLPSHPPSLTISFTLPTGACCKPDGTCDLLTRIECSAQSGNYGGDNSTCAQLVCLEPYVDWLPTPPVAIPVRGRAGGEAFYEITMKEFRQKLHRDLPPTTLWGYNGQYPGPTIEAYRNRPVQVRWINDLRDYETGLPRTNHYFDIDTRIHGPDAEGKTPRTVVHLHGGHVPPESDGFPESTFVSGGSRLYRYPNTQLPTTLWYHDHALGITRYNVMMGLAGLYLIRDRDEEALHLPSGPYEIPLVIQDRSFNPDGSLRYPAQWTPMFVGDKVLVNGRVWPKLRVDSGRYRFRVLNGSNHRIFTLALSDHHTFHVIGSDGGLLSSPAEVSEISLGPAERADLVLDFEGYASGAEVLLQDNLEAGQVDASDPAASRIMKFIVSGTPGWTAPLPPFLDHVERIPESQATRTRTFELRFDPRLQQYRFGDFGWGEATEFPVLGTTEIWQFANETSETHPIHMHLVQFQILDRSSFQVVDGRVVPSSPRRPPNPEEAGWKDTAKVKPLELLRVIMRFGPDGFLGDYVFHCHMLEHEDNEMMRRFRVVPPGGPKAVVATNDPQGTRNAFTTSLGWPRIEGVRAIVEYTLAEPGEVTLAVFDVAGRRVASLADAVQETGVHEALFKLHHVARGIYFVRMRAGGRVFVRRMPILKTTP